MARRAAAIGAQLIRDALNRRGEASIVVATGLSQVEMLQHLVEADSVDWSRVTAFHLDEYVGLSADHPASFRKYLKERFVDQLPEDLRAFHFIDAEDDPQAEIRRLNKLIANVTIDIAFIGIGENGHLAFNDPPADFQTTDPYLLVTLDEACRRQQLGEGWFPSLDEVPSQAVSMSIHQILLSNAIVCTVPDRRKAEAVRDALEGPVTPDVPASILQRDAACRLFLDQDAASLLSDAPQTG